MHNYIKQISILINLVNIFKNMMWYYLMKYKILHWFSLNLFNIIKINVNKYLEPEM